MKGQTNTEDAHERLESLGVSPRLKSAASPADAFPFVVFSAPPSGSDDYAAEVRAALKAWDGTGGFVFTSSTAVYAGKDCEECDESFAAPLVASMGACPSPTVTTEVKGQATLAGLSLEDAQQNEFVIVAALADLHEVETTAVAVAFSSYTRRRLSGGVVVAYTIAYDDVAPALALDAAMFDQALTDAAAASGVADVFVAVETVAFGGSDEEAPVAAAAENEETGVVSDAAFRPLGRGVLLAAAAAACLL